MSVLGLEGRELELERKLIKLMAKKLVFESLVRKHFYIEAHRIMSEEEREELSYLMLTLYQKVAAKMTRTQFRRTITAAAARKLVEALGKLDC